MLFKRMSVFLHKTSEVNIREVNGLYEDYVLELDDVEIRLPREKIKDLFDKLKGVVDGTYEKENSIEK